MNGFFSGPDDYFFTPSLEEEHLIKIICTYLNAVLGGLGGGSVLQDKPFLQHILLCGGLLREGVKKNST